MVNSTYMRTQHFYLIIIVDGSFMYHTYTYKFQTLHVGIYMHVATSVEITTLAHGNHYSN